MISEEELLEQFQTLCQKSRATEDTAEDDGLSTYEAILHFIQDHPEHKQLLVSKMVVLVRELRDARKRGGVDLSPDAIGYCMKVLQWPEVYKAADQVHKEYFERRRSAVLSPIFDAYRRPESDVDF